MSTHGQTWQTIVIHAVLRPMGVVVTEDFTTAYLAAEPHFGSAVADGVVAAGTPHNGGILKVRIRHAQLTNK